MTCDNCVKYDACLAYNGGMTRIMSMKNKAEEECGHFKNKADFVEVETLKTWLYEMAINNVGCVLDGDFSVACQEIISRLDGLRKFAMERK